MPSSPPFLVEFDEVQHFTEPRALTLERIPPDHPLLRGSPDHSALAMKPRAYVSEEMGDKPSDVMLLQAGKGLVVVSPLDLTSGLLGTNTLGILGYDTDSASRFVANVLAWAGTSPTQ